MPRAVEGNRDNITRRRAVLLTQSDIQKTLFMGGGARDGLHSGQTGQGASEDFGMSGRVDGVGSKHEFADYSWKELKEISARIAAAGSDAEGLAIAKEYNLVDEGGRLRGDDTKAITLKDKHKTTAWIRILGFRHDELAGGGKAGISFEFADVSARHRMNPGRTNEGGWERSKMRGWLNDGRAGFLALLPDDLRPHVALAMKRTNNTGEVMRKNDNSPVTATPDALWLLSVSEVYGGVPSWMYSPATCDAEGTQYKLYADKGVTAENYGFCVKHGADSWWWLRSPRARDSHGFHNVSRDGDWDFGNAGSEWGVSPGFCF